jgi:hypothetical protein
MITYNSGLRNAPPATAPILADAKADLLRKSPYGYPSNHQDILNALGQKSLANLQHSAERADTDYALQQQRAQDDLTLTGLQSMANAQKQQRDVETAKQGLAMNAYSGLLSGLFQ